MVSQAWLDPGIQRMSSGSPTAYLSAPIFRDPSLKFSHLLQLGSQQKRACFLPVNSLTSVNWLQAPGCVLLLGCRAPGPRGRQGLLGSVVKGEWCQTGSTIAASTWRPVKARMDCAKLGCCGLTPNPWKRVLYPSTPRPVYPASGGLKEHTSLPPPQLLPHCQRSQERRSLGRFWLPGLGSTSENEWAEDSQWCWPSTGLAAPQDHPHPARALSLWASLTMPNTVSKIRGQVKNPGYPQSEACWASA